MTPAVRSRTMRQLITAVALGAGLLLPASAFAQTAPCPPGTPLAMTITGLPGEIEFGPNHYFDVEQTYVDDWWPQSVYHFRMEDAATHEPFAEGDARASQLFMQLDKEDGPVMITASWEQESYVTGESCRHSITETVSGYRRYRVPTRCGYDDADPKPHPRLIVIACGDGNRGLHHLRWRGWNTRQATATGDVYANDCKPYCARGRFHDYPTKVRLWRPRGGEGEPYVYTRMSYRLGGRTWRYRLKTDKYGSYWV